MKSNPGSTAVIRDKRTLSIYIAYPDQRITSFLSHVSSQLLCTDYNINIVGTSQFSEFSHQYAQGSPFELEVIDKKLHFDLFILGINSLKTLEIFRNIALQYRRPMLVINSLPLDPFVIESFSLIPKATILQAPPRIELIRDFFTQNLS